MSETSQLIVGEKVDDTDEEACLRARLLARKTEQV